MQKPNTNFTKIILKIQIKNFLKEVSLSKNKTLQFNDNFFIADIQNKFLNLRDIIIGKNKGDFATKQPAVASY